MRGALGGALAGGLAAAGAYAALRHLPPGLGARWQRTNHAGKPVTLLEGPAVTVGLLAGFCTTGSVQAGAMAASVGAACFGAIDDLSGDTAVKGLSGHLGALARGEVSTGALKIVGIGASALVGAWAQDRPARSAVMSTALGAGVIAGSANVANLLDLRPGRALKAVLIAAAPVVLGGGRPTRTALVTSGAAIGVLGADLRGEAMLGDTGANAVGAAVGAAIADRLGTRGRALAFAVVLGLTVLSERVSFSQVIDRTAVLRDLDRWGRRPT